MWFPVRAYRDEAVVLQDSSFPIAETLGDFSSFFTIQDHASEVGVNSVTFVESQAILSHHIELPAKDRERFAVNTGLRQSSYHMDRAFKFPLPVSMARSMYIRPSLVDLRMNRKSRRVDRFIANHDLAIFVDQNEIADANLRKVARQRVQPYNGISVT